MKKLDDVLTPEVRAAVMIQITSHPQFDEWNVTLLPMRESPSFYGNHRELAEAAHMAVSSWRFTGGRE